MLRVEMVKDKALKEKLIHGSFPHAITLPRKIAAVHPMLIIHVSEEHKKISVLFLSM